MTVKKQEPCKLTISHLGEQLELDVRPGLGFQAVSVRHREVPIEYDCREADCGICIVKVLAGSDHLSPPAEKESDFLKAMHADPDERLACQCRILGDVHIKTDLF